MIFTLNKTRLFFLFGIIIFSFCSDLFLTEIELPKTDCINDDIVCTYSEHIKPILELNCAYSGCHNSNNPTAGLSLSTYENIISSNIIQPGDTLNSILLDRIKNENIPMPPSGIMSQSYINIIAKWIQDGAPE